MVTIYYKEQYENHHTSAVKYIMTFSNSIAIFSQPNLKFLTSSNFANYVQLYWCKAM